MNTNYPTSEYCHQCGFMHPPLPSGEKCPMAKEKTKSGIEINFELFFSKLKPLLAHFINTNNIEDQEKFFKDIIDIIINELKNRY